MLYIDIYYLKCLKTGNADFWSTNAPKQNLTIAIDLGGSFTSLAMSCDERSNGVVSLLPITINSGPYRLGNSLYNPFAEILIYDNPKAMFIIKTSNKIEEENKMLKKCMIKTNQFTDYNTISIKDYR